MIAEFASSIGGIRPVAKLVGCQSGMSLTDYGCHKQSEPCCNERTRYGLLIRCKVVGTSLSRVVSA